MRIERKPMTELLPADYNPRKPLQPGSKRYERLKRSLLEFGLVQPLVWNARTGRLVGGHQRLSVLQELGETDVEVVVVELSAAREKALNVALNNADVMGEWDHDKLAGLVDELAALPDFDATLTGFDADTLRALTMAPVEMPKLADPHEACVQVTLKVAADEWEALRPKLQGALAGHGCELHVRM